MIEGMIVANDLTGIRADQVRSALWLAVDDDAIQQPVPENELAARPDPTAPDQARAAAV